MTERYEAGVDDPAGSQDAADLFRTIGRQIKAARERAGMSQRELGRLCGYSEEQISSIERGRRTPQPDFLIKVDELLGCGGLLAVAAEDVERVKQRRRVRHPEWFQDYADLEKKAVEVHEYGSLAIPGLLQTEAHANAVFRTRRPPLDEKLIERRLVARLDRQEIFERRPTPFATFVIEESVLRRPLGGWDIHQEQLEALLRSGSVPSVDIQVLPTGCAEHPSLGGSFIMLTPKGRPQLGYIEIQHYGHLVTDPDEVRVLAARYGSLRAQALTPSESRSLIKEILGER